MATARESCVRSNSSRDEPGREIPPRLPAVEQAEPDVDRQRAAGARPARSSVPPRGGERCRRVSGRWLLERLPWFRIDLAADEATLDAARVAGVADEVEPLARRLRDRDEDRVGPRLERRSGRISSALPRTGTPSRRRRHSLGSSSTKPTTLLPGRLAQLARRLRPLRPAPTTSTRRRGPAPRSVVTPRYAARSQKREAPTSSVQSSASMTKIARGKSPRGRVRRDHAPGDELGEEHGCGDARRVACVGVAPHAAVEPERDEREVAREQEDRQQRHEVPLLRRRPVRAEPQHVRGVERDGDEDGVDEHLDEAAAMDDDVRRKPSRRSAIDVGLRSTSARKLANWTNSANVSATPITVIFASSMTLYVRLVAPSTPRSPPAGSPRAGPRGRGTRAGATCGRGRPGRSAGPRTAARS